MSQMKSKLAPSLFRDLQYAAIYPNKRHYFIFRSLNKYLSMTEAIGVALIRYATRDVNEYKVIYCGQDQAKMDHWLNGRVVPSMDVTIANLDRTPSIFPNAKTQFIPYEEGLFVIWHHHEITIFDEFHKTLSDYLKAISYIEKSEQTYFFNTEQPFEPELSKLIAHKDQDGLTELLSLTKTVSDSDFVFWGDATSKHVEVATHLGSENNGFGFRLPIGQGIGGHAAQNKSLLQVGDYKNCEYRYQEVSTAVDRENVRTVFALPIKDQEANTSGVLYASNREVKPFSIQTNLMLLRLGHSIEPLTKQRELKQFFTENHYATFVREKKQELRNIIQNARQVAELEIWLAELVKGEVMILNKKGQSYTTQPAETLQTKKQRPFSFPLEQDQKQLGELLIWTDMTLPLKGWVDFMDDVISAIYIILEREKRVYRAIELERSQWINSLLHSQTVPHSQYEKGIRLRLPVDRGEIWTIYWETEEEQLTTREKIQLEEVVLKKMKNPLIFSGNLGFILFDKPWPCQPEELRNHLLKVLPVTTWMVHSARYATFQKLQDSLIQLQLLIERISTFGQKKYVLEFNDFGLDHLLTNPNVTDDLNKFALNALEPIIKYDQKNGTQFTKTLALSLVYPSPADVASRLFIHRNTVHYRVNRAKELLEMDLDKPGNDIALRLAAYTWLYHERENQ